jgi:hypothetical protein
VKTSPVDWSKYPHEQSLFCVASTSAATASPMYRIVAANKAIECRKNAECEKRSTSSIESEWRDPLPVARYGKQPFQ